MKLMLCVLSALFFAARITDAQSDPSDEVQIIVRPFVIAANGAEKAVPVARHFGLAIGKPTVGVFSMAGCGTFTVATPPNPFEEKATAGWRVEVTPLKIVNRAVTMRLRWVRALDNSDGYSPVSEDVEVTLQPGESRPLDSVPVVQSGAKTIDGGPCRTKSASLRVSVDFQEPHPGLIAADVWLVERLPNGKEESQRQSVRGLPHRPLSFYFDGVPGGPKRFDFFGKLVADPEQGGLQVSVETTTATAHPGENRNLYEAVRWFRSTLHMKPDEIVEVALKADEKPPALGNRAFSIRIRAKQIR